MLPYMYILLGSVTLLYLSILGLLVLVVALLLHVGVALVLRPPLRGGVPLIPHPRPDQGLGEHGHSANSLSHR